MSLTLGGIDSQGADDGLHHQEGKKTVSVADGDGAAGFLQHDVPQRSFRRHGYAGPRPLRPAARIAGLAFPEAVLLWRFAVADVVVAGGPCQSKLA